MKTYIPQEVSVIVGGNIMSGFADGTFVQAERDEDAFSFTPSTSGGGTRTKSASKSGKVTITLHQASESNAILSDIASKDEKDGSGVVAIMIRDNSGKTLHKSDAAYITKMPQSQFGKELQNREWVFQCEELSMYEGGN